MLRKKNKDADGVVEYLESGSGSRETRRRKKEKKIVVNHIKAAVQDIFSFS